MKNAGVLLVVLIWLGSCSGSRKAAINASHPVNTEYDHLTQKLNIQVNQQCNLKLYRFIDAWYGVPHKDGGCTKNGVDCSCFVKQAVDEVYRKQIPRNSYEIYTQTTPTDTSKLKEGDLVFFTTKSSKVSHVGIYLKDQKFVHVSTSKGVRINSLTENYYRKYFAGAAKLD